MHISREFSPEVSGQSGAGGAVPSLITDPHLNFAFFPLDNPGIVSRWRSSSAGPAR